MPQLQLLTGTFSLGRLLPNHGTHQKAVGKAKEGVD